MKKLVISGVIMEMIPFIKDLLIEHIEELHVLTYEIYGQFIVGALCHMFIGVFMCSTMVFLLKAERRIVTVPVIFLLCNLIMICYYMKYNANLLMYFFMFVGYWSGVVFLTVKKSNVKNVYAIYLASEL